MDNKLCISDVFGFIKPHIDVHTMGMFTMANLLRDCGYIVNIAKDDVCIAIENIQKLNNYGLVKKWIYDNHITIIGFSYRLDPQEGCDYFLSLYEHLKNDHFLKEDGGTISKISFAGLPETCERIKAKIKGNVILFKGDESPIESLKLYGVPETKLPSSIVNNHPYDTERWSFAKKLIESEKYKVVQPQDHWNYDECGTDDDSFIKRLNYAKKTNSLPLIRTHCGPYNSNRLEALKEFNSWCKTLANYRLLDVLSIGSSQLTQSHFGEKWGNLPNGGGVPVNSELEYQIIKENAIPMLVRTYSGTKNVPDLAQIHERALNISWHALSFWWFNEIDGRGENTLLNNLKEHFKAIHYIATTGKPVEPNVPHHFAFRGSDDISYIISGYLAAKACKKMGIKHLILQNMLNTPKYTWGIQDIAKGRAMYRLVKELQDNNFHVYLQSRAGLDYFAPDLDIAKIQLAAVTCLMDDICPEEYNSPEIIHVVNYCEAVKLATPPIIKESIQITLNSLHEYRIARSLGKIPNMKYDKETQERTEALYQEANEAIHLLEKNIPNLYTPEGFYKVFNEGFLPVPYLMDYNNKFKKATYYHTALKNGGIRVVDDQGGIINTTMRYKKIIANMN